MKPPTPAKMTTPAKTATTAAASAAIGLRLGFVHVNRAALQIVAGIVAERGKQVDAGRDQVLAIDLTGVGARGCSLYIDPLATAGHTVSGTGAAAMTLTLDAPAAGANAPESSGEGGDLATVVRLEEEDGDRYWVTFENFYVITRYNHSAMYAMSVYQLSQQLADGAGR